MSAVNEINTFAGKSPFIETSSRQKSQQV